MCKENINTMNYLGAYLFNTSFRYRPTKNKIYVHVVLKVKYKKPRILYKFSTKCVNSKISSNIQ